MQRNDAPASESSDGALDPKLRRAWFTPSGDAARGKTRGVTNKSSACSSQETYASLAQAANLRSTDSSR
jgi:hypothetical protein